jgi:formylglycine-generating enzyme
MPLRVVRFDVKSEWRSAGAATARAILGAVSLVTSCTGERPASPAPDCSADAKPGFACAWDGGCVCISLTTDLPPVADIRFQLQRPRDENDYPYGAENPPPAPPGAGSTLYLSADGSADPEGAPIALFWNVQDPSGLYLSVTPSPGAADISFTPVRIGTYTISLEVSELHGLHQIGQAQLALTVAPTPCASDGVSPPCADGLPVAGGAFFMGSPDGVGNDDEHPRHAVTVAPFVLDKYEVTVGRFRRYLANYGGASPADGAGAHPLIPNSGWQTAAWANTVHTVPAELSSAIVQCGGVWTAELGPSEARPVSCVDWYEAFAMCIWEGKRLPTEEEWEYAAAGGNEQRTYPWGNAPPTSANAVFGCLFDGVPGCSDADLPVVGSLPLGAGRWGQLDLAGSVWEWTLDMYAPYTTDPCDSCANLTAGMGRVFRGGDYKFDDPSSLRAASRYAFDESFPDPTRGFRCAQSPADAALSPVAAVDAGLADEGGTPPIPAAGSTTVDAGD